MSVALRPNNVGFRAMEDFGKRLRAARESRGLTQDDVAYRSGVSRSSLQNWESGRRVPGLGDIALVADVIDCSLDWLAGRSSQTEARGGDGGATLVAPSELPDLASAPPRVQARRLKRGRLTDE